MQTKAAFFSFKDWHMSLLTTGVAVAVKATMGTLNVQNGDAGKGHTMSKQIHIKLFCLQWDVSSVSNSLAWVSNAICFPLQ